MLSNMYNVTSLIYRKNLPCLDDMDVLKLVISGQTRPETPKQTKVNSP